MNGCSEQALWADFAFLWQDEGKAQFQDCHALD